MIDDQLSRRPIHLILKMQIGTLLECFYGLKRAELWCENVLVLTRVFAQLLEMSTYTSRISTLALISSV